MRYVGLWIAGLLLGVGVTLIVCDRAEAHHDSHRVIQPCATEDQPTGPCVWLASHMGNGKGRSFRVFRDGRVKFITHRWAFHLLGDCDSNGPVYC